MLATRAPTMASVPAPSRIHPVLVIAVFGAAALICLTLLVIQLAAALGTVPLVAGAAAAGGWLVKAAIGAPALLLLACLLVLAAVSPWFLLGGIALLARGGAR